MENSVKITLIIVFAAIFLALLATAIYFAVNPLSKNTITTDGVAKVTAEPDLVSVYFTIETYGETAKDAKDENADILNEITIDLLREGFDRDDIITENYNVYQNYDWRTGKKTDYVANHRLKVKLSSDDIDETGEVIDSVVDNNASLNYINWELSQEKQNELKAEALEQATLDAKSKAEGIARGLGKELGRVVSVKSSDFYYEPWRLYEANTDVIGMAEVAQEAKAATTNIQPDEEEISARVQVSFTIK